MNLYWIGQVPTENFISKIRTSHVWLKKFINRSGNVLFAAIQCRDPDPLLSFSVSETVSQSSFAITPAMTTILFCERKVDKVKEDKFCALTMAAGKGTRMKSDLAKVLHFLDGKPLLHYFLSPEF
jgi:hypothetical protein